MDFKELIADFATRHNVEDFVAEDDAAALDIDGIVVTLIAVGEGKLTLIAEIGEPPSDGRAVFADMLLEENYGSELVFAKAPEDGGYRLMRHLALDGLDGAALDAAMETLVNASESWRKLLADFRPAAAEAAAAAEPPTFGTGGFLQV